MGDPGRASHVQLGSRPNGEKRGTKLRRVGIGVLPEGEQLPVFGVRFVVPSARLEDARELEARSDAARVRRQDATPRTIVSELRRKGLTQEEAEARVRAFIEAEREK